MSLSLSYEPRARCVLEIDGKEIWGETNRMADSLDELVTAAWALVAHGSTETVFFLASPGCSLWTLQPQSARLQVSVVEWDHFFYRNERPGRVTFEAECRLRTFAGAVLSAAQHVFETQGQEGYQAIAGYRFPTERMGDLQRVLRENKT